MDPKKTDVVVIGAGPGGYAAAFYAAAKGKKVILVEKASSLGGVCLNRGCIPSKALIHATEVMHEAKNSSHRGVIFSEPTLDLDKMREWKSGIISKLSKGIRGMAKKRKVEVMTGRGFFDSKNVLRVESEEGQTFIEFEQAIIAVGSDPMVPAAFDLGNPRIMTSTEALDIEDVPKSLLVVGGGYIGMELGTVYAYLGSEVVMVEAMDSILAGADPDLARPVSRKAKANFKELRLSTRVKSMATKGKKIEVVMELDGKLITESYDKVLVSIGRKANSANLGLENIGVNLDDRGFISVDHQQKTSLDHIFAIGDISGGILLAHKASHDAKVAVDAILGENSTTEHRIIPAVVFTDPEVAWCGLTETEAKANNIKVKVSKFPWGASGRALTLDRPDGLTKLIIEPETERILGVGIVGVGAGNLISEGMLAVDMGATVEDLSEVIHPHPTLSETLLEAAESFYGASAHS
jgi:dihydrolipoamide dehydrogenase